MRYRISRSAIAAVPVLAILSAGAGAAMAAMAAIAGATWQSEGAATLKVEADGQVSGSTGCNRYSGSAELGNGMTIRFGPLATTRMACKGPRMEEEQAFIAALENARSYRFEAGNLVLLDGSGAVVATFTLGQ